jgi:uncharacterized protein (TIGR00369 family)
MDTRDLRRVMEDFIPFNKFLGLRVTVLERGFVRMEIPFRLELVGDPMRPALHGGVISTLADTAGGCAVWQTVLDERARVSTIDLRVDYLLPAKLEMLVGEARVVRLGNRVGVAEIKVFHGDAPDAIIATGKGVYNISVPASDRGAGEPNAHDSGQLSDG